MIRTDNPARATIVVVVLGVDALAAAQGLARRTTSSSASRCAGAGNASLAGLADSPARAAIVVVALEIGFAAVIQIVVAVGVEGLASEGTAAAGANREAVLA